MPLKGPYKTINEPYLYSLWDIWQSNDTLENLPDYDRNSPVLFQKDPYLLKPDQRVTRPFRLGNKTMLLDIPAMVIYYKNKNNEILYNNTILHSWDDNGFAINNDKFTIIYNTKKYEIEITNRTDEDLLLTTVGVGTY